MIEFRNVSFAYPDSPEGSLKNMEALEELIHEKTVIMIAHRLKTVRHADQILVVDKGQIVQQGTHDELMERDGIYRRFISGRKQAVGWKLQSPSLPQA